MINTRLDVAKAIDKEVKNLVMKDYSYILNSCKQLQEEAIERFLGLTISKEIECLCCKIKSNMVFKVYIPASTSGASGYFDLCLDCGQESLLEAEWALQEYYSSIY